MKFIKLFLFFIFFNLFFYVILSKKSAKVIYNFDLLPSFDDFLEELNLSEVKSFLISSGFISSQRLLNIKQEDFNLIVFQILEKNKQGSNYKLTLKETKEIIKKLNLRKNSIILTEESKTSLKWNYFDGDWSQYYKQFNKLDKFDHSVPPPGVDATLWNKRSIYKTSSILLHSQFESVINNGKKHYVPIVNFTLNNNYRLLAASIGSPPPYGIVPVVISNDIFQCSQEIVQKRLEFYHNKLDKFKKYKKNEFKNYVKNYKNYLLKNQNYNADRFKLDILYEIKVNILIKVLNDLYNKINLFNFFRDPKNNPYNVNIKDLYEKYKENQKILHVNKSNMEFSEEKVNLIPKKFERLYTLSNNLLNNTEFNINLSSEYNEDLDTISKRNYHIQEELENDKMLKSYNYKKYINKMKKKLNIYENYTLNYFFINNYSNISFYNNNYILFNSIIKNELKLLNITENNFYANVNIRFKEGSYLVSRTNEFYESNENISYNSSINNNSLYNFYLLNDNLCYYYDKLQKSTILYSYYYPNDFCYNSTSVFSFFTHSYKINYIAQNFFNPKIYSTPKNNLFFQKYLTYSKFLSTYITNENIQSILNDIYYTLDNFDSIDFNSEFPSFYLYSLNLIRKLENYHNNKLPKKPTLPTIPLNNKLPELDSLYKISEYNITNFYNILNSLTNSEFHLRCHKFNTTDIQNKNEFSQNKIETSSDDDLELDNILESEMEKFNLNYSELFKPTILENQYTECEYTQFYDNYLNTTSKNINQRFNFNNSFFLPYIKENYNNSLVLLFRGGGCNFIDKSLYFKSLGARGVIIINNSTDMPLTFGGFGVDPSIDYDNLIKLNDFFISLISQDNGMKLINDIINSQLLIKKSLRINSNDSYFDHFSRFNISIIPEYCQGGFNLCSPVLEYEKSLLSSNKKSFWGEMEIINHTKNNSKELENEKLFYLSSNIESFIPQFNEELIIFKAEPFDACSELILPEFVENNYYLKNNLNYKEIYYNNYLLINSSFPQLKNESYALIQNKMYSYGIVFNINDTKCSHQDMLININKSGAKFAMIVNNNDLKIPKNYLLKSNLYSLKKLDNIFSYFKKINSLSFLNYLPIFSFSYSASQKLLSLPNKKFFKVKLKLIPDISINYDIQGIDNNYYNNYVYLTNEIVELNKNNFYLDSYFNSKMKFYFNLLKNFKDIENILFNNNIIHDKISDYLNYIIFILEMKYWIYNLVFYSVFFLFLIIGFFIIFYRKY